MRLSYLFLIAFLWAALAPVTSAQCSLPQQQLTADDAAVDDFFGTSVALARDLAVVGTQRGDGRVADSGSAYLYRFDGTAWWPETELVATDGDQWDYFGFAVATNGRDVLVGALGDADGGHQAGAVYAYRPLAQRQAVRFHQPTIGGPPPTAAVTWVEQKLPAPVGLAASNHFGYSVAMSGDVAVIGARGTGGSFQGAAYIYRFDGSTWTEEQKLTAPSPSPSDSFGESVAIDGERVVVGAPGDDEAASNAGAAFVFEYDTLGESWDPVDKLMASDAARLGQSVAISGDVIVAGSPDDDDLGLWSGSAYVYRYDGVGWLPDGKLFGSGTSSLKSFGWSVAVDGDVILAGEAAVRSTSLLTSLYVFEHDGVTWNEIRVLNSANQVTGDSFGCAVATADGRVLCGALYQDDGGNRAGAAYTFDFQIGHTALQLDARPAVASGGQTLTWDTCRGHPQNPGMLFMVAFNGSPLFTPLFADAFDALGLCQANMAVPTTPYVPGNIVTFRAYGIGPGGQLIQSPDADIEFQ